MNKYLFIAFLGVLLVSCNKVKKTQKTLTGVWELHQYKKTLPTGLVYYYEGTGTMSFGSCEDNSLCDYCLDVTYSNQGNTFEKKESGTLEVLEDGTSLILNRINSDGSIDVLDYANILLLTKDDLKIEFADESGLHEFIFLK